MTQNVRNMWQIWVVKSLTTLENFQDPGTSSSAWFAYFSLPPWMWDDMHGQRISISKTWKYPSSHAYQAHILNVSLSYVQDLWRWPPFMHVWTSEPDSRNMKKWSQDVVHWQISTNKQVCNMAIHGECVKEKDKIWLIKKAGCSFSSRHSVLATFMNGWPTDTVRASLGLRGHKEQRL